MKKPKKRLCKCGHIACVCDVIESHTDDTCKYRRAVTCPVGIECEHGHDVCPICDSCTCFKGNRDHSDRDIQHAGG